jgi:flagellar basal-body rod protein FlgF
MEANLYVGLSGQIALQKRMETIANNVANTSTPGYRAEEVRFQSLISEASRDPTAFASTGESYLVRRSGGLTHTGNTLDVAVKGEAFLAIQTPAGQVYTRDGRMQMSEAGELQTLNGYPVLDAGGAPIQLDPNGGAVRIGADGTLTQNDRQLGALGLFTIPADANLTRFENSGVVPDVPAEPALNFAKIGVAQGFIEQSNVNPVSEITRLVMVTRAFEAVTNILNQSEQQQRDSIRALGPNS